MLFGGGAARWRITLNPTDTPFFRRFVQERGATRTGRDPRRSARIRARKARRASRRPSATCTTTSPTWRDEERSRFARVAARPSLDRARAGVGVRSRVQGLPVAEPPRQAAVGPRHPEVRAVRARRLHARGSGRAFRQLEHLHQRAWATAASATCGSRCARSTIATARARWSSGLIAGIIAEVGHRRLPRRPACRKFVDAYDAVVERQDRGTATSARKR